SAGPARASPRTWPPTGEWRTARSPRRTGRTGGSPGEAAASHAARGRPGGAPRSSPGRGGGREGIRWAWGGSGDGEVRAARTGERCASKEGDAADATGG